MKDNFEVLSMKGPRLLLCAALAAAFSAALPAQQAPSGFHSVNCIKIKAEKSGEFHKWVSDVLQKYAQSRVDSGAISNWYLLRSVIPQGSSATCDYLTVSMYPGAPSEPLSADQMTAALKSAGLSLNRDEYIARRDSVATLVSTQMFRNVESVGAAKKGGYLSVAYMKTANLDEWLNAEKKLWKPLAEQMVKDGVQSGWSVNLEAYGLQSELPYQGVTVDFFPSWDAVWKDDPQFVDRLKKVHPETDPTAMFEQISKARSMVAQQLFAIEDLITAKK
jgi:hypothetical protein